MQGEGVPTRQDVLTELEKGDMAIRKAKQKAERRTRDANMLEIRAERGLR